MSRITILVMALLFTVALFAQDMSGKPTERIGNETAAFADSLFKLGSALPNSDPQAKEYFAQSAAKYQEAYDLFVKAQKEDGAVVDQKLTSMVNNMITCYGKAGDYPNYIRLSMKEWKKDPSDFRMSKNLALAYRGVGKPDSAVYVLSECDKLKPSADAEQLAGQIRLLQAKEIDKDTKQAVVPAEALPLYNEALVWYQKYIGMRSDASAIDLMAQIHIRLGNNQAAIDAYTQFLATNPGDTQKRKAYLTMGKMYEDLGNKAQAADSYFNANGVTYDIKISQKLVLMYYNDLNNKTKAQECVSLILKNNPGDALATYYDAEMKYLAGNLSAAKTEFQSITTDRNFGDAAQSYIKKIEAEQK